MLKTRIIQIYAFNAIRNFSYVLYNQKKDIVICIDPYSSEDIIRVLNENDLNLTHIINTHEHWDHIKGNQDLVRKYNPLVCSHEKSMNIIPFFNTILSEADEIILEEDEVLHVLDTPGHSMSHICLLLNKQSKPYCIFSGDTLFQAGVGNCKTGDVVTLYKTVCRLLNILSEDSLVYPGHHYIKHNLSFTLSIEKDNKNSKDLLESILAFRDSNKFICTNMAQEKSINLFLKSIHNFEEFSSKIKGDFSRSQDLFCSLRSLRDSF